MSRRSIIPESIIVPKDFEQFAILFSSMYTVFATQHNKQVVFDSNHVFLSSKPTQIASFEPGYGHTALLLLIPEDRSKPTAIYLYAYFSALNVSITPIFTSSSSASLSLQDNNGEVFATLTNGSGDYRIKVVRI